MELLECGSMHFMPRFFSVERTDVKRRNDLGRIMLANQTLGTSGLLIHHEVMLLSICDKTGKTSAASSSIGSASGILIELILRGRVSIGRDKCKVVSVSPGSTGIQLLDESLALIASVKRKLSIHAAIMKVAAMPKLAQRVIDELCARKIIRAEKAKVMLLFDRTSYPTVDGKAEREIRSRMARLLFGQTTSHDRRTTLLVVVAKQLGLLTKNFDPARLERNKERIEKVVKGESFKARASMSAKLAMDEALQAASIVGVAVSGG